MPRPRCRLTPTLEKQILGYIRAGGFPQVAAEAAGVPREVFADWLAQGRRAGARAPYRAFAWNVIQAIAQARLKAEIAVRDKDARFWLRYGPGREMPGAPGWTGPAKPSTAPAGEINALAHPEWGRLWRLMLAALEPFPQARAAVAEALAGDAPRPAKSLRLPAPRSEG